MGYDVRIQEKLFFAWDSALFIGGYQYGCSGDAAEAEELRRLIEVDDEPSEEDVAETVRTQSGETRFCYMLRLPRPFRTRFILPSVDEYARAMHAEDDVEITFGHLTKMNYLWLLGTLEKRRMPKGQSCLVLNAHTSRIILAANEPPMLIRISALPGEISPLPAA